MGWEGIRHETTQWTYVWDTKAIGCTLGPSRRISEVKSSLSLYCNNAAI